MKELYLCDKCETDKDVWWRLRSKSHDLCDECNDIFDEYMDRVNFIQPERSKREDSQKCEMRCSEHCGNTVRKVQ